MYADGDGDGLRARDIRSGVDARLADFERIGDRFPGVAIGIAAAMPGIAGGATLPAGSDPIRFGASDGLTFSPLGTATSDGTLADPWPISRGCGRCACGRVWKRCWWIYLPEERWLKRRPGFVRE